MFGSSRGDEAHYFNSAFKIPNSAVEMSLLTSAPTSGRFESRAVIAPGGIPNKVQAGDMGVDGAATFRAILSHTRSSVQTCRRL
jgi:hypothetical protein